MSRADPQMKIRLPADLKDRIEENSMASGRSMNAEIIHMIQSYFTQMYAEVEEIKATLEKANRSNISIGLNDPVYRAAVLKVLLLEELMLLRRRVDSLGGSDAVLKLDKAEIAKKVEGPKLKGTTEEQKSHFSQILPTYPLTALLTTEELERLAERVVALQTAIAKPDIKKKT